MVCVWVSSFTWTTSSTLQPQARIDALGDTPNLTVGLEYREKVERRLRQLEGTDIIQANKAGVATGPVSQSCSHHIQISFTEFCIGMRTVRMSAKYIWIT